MVGPAHRLELANDGVVISVRTVSRHLAHSG